MVRKAARGLGLLDLIVVLALLALLVWLVEGDWRRMSEPSGAPPATGQNT